MKAETALYYYPTNVVLVDDNKMFLSSLRQALQLTSPHLCYDTYSDPIEALEKINANYIELLKQQPSQSDTDEEYTSQFVFDVLNKGNLVQSNQQRFNEISVLVVDLDMPEIDGIEFCKKIRSPNIKKILLTGTTDTDRVLDAFNNDDIHFYLKKGQEDIDTLLEQAIARFQYKYFLDISSKIKSVAVEGSVTLLSDPAFAQYFADLHKTLRVKEFYFQSSPARYTLELMDGAQALLLVYSEEDIKEHLQVMKEQGAPDYLIKSVSHGEIPYFTTADGFYETEHPSADSWTTYKADIIQGKQRYFCALLQDNIPSHQHCSTIPTPSSNTLH